MSTPDQQSARITKEEYLSVFSLTPGEIERQQRTIQAAVASIQGAERERLLSATERFHREALHLPESMSEEQALGFVQSEETYGKTFDEFSTAESREVAQHFRRRSLEARKKLHELFEAKALETVAQNTIPKEEFLMTIASNLLSPKMQEFMSKMSADQERVIDEMDTDGSQSINIGEAVTKAQAEEYFRFSEGASERLLHTIESFGLPGFAEYAQENRRVCQKAREAAMALFERSPAARKSPMHPRELSEAMKTLRKTVNETLAKASAEKRAIAHPTRTLVDAWNCIVNVTDTKIEEELAKTNVKMGKEALSRMDDTLLAGFRREFAALSDDEPLTKDAATRLVERLTDIVQSYAHGGDKGVKLGLKYYGRRLQRMRKTVHSMYAGKPTMTFGELLAIVARRQREDVRFTGRAVEMRESLREKELRAYDDATEKIRVEGPNFEEMGVLLNLDAVSAHLSEGMRCAKKVLEKNKKVPERAAKFILDCLASVHDGVRQEARQHIAELTGSDAFDGGETIDAGTFHEKEVVRSPVSGATLTVAEYKTLSKPAMDRMLAVFAELMQLFPREEQSRLLQVAQTLDAVPPMPEVLTRADVLEQTQMIDASNKPMLDALKALHNPEVNAKVAVLEQSASIIRDLLLRELDERDRLLAHAQPAPTATDTSDEKGDGAVIARPDILRLTSDLSHAATSKARAFAQGLGSDQRLQIMEAVGRLEHVNIPDWLPAGDADAFIATYHEAASRVLELVKAAGGKGDVVATLERFIPEVRKGLEREFAVIDWFNERLVSPVPPSELRVHVQRLHDAIVLLQERHREGAQALALPHDIVMTAWSYARAMAFPNEAQAVGSLVFGECETAEEANELRAFERQTVAHVTGLIGQHVEHGITAAGLASLREGIDSFIGASESHARTSKSEARALIVDLLRRRCDLLLDSLTVVLDGRKSLTCFAATDACNEANKRRLREGEKMFAEFHGQMTPEEWKHYDARLKEFSSRWDGAIPLFVDEPMMRRFFEESSLPGKSLLNDPKLRRKFGERHVEHNRKTHELSLQLFLESLENGTPALPVGPETQGIPFAPGLKGPEAGWLGRVLVAKLLSLEKMDDFERFHTLEQSTADRTMVMRVNGLSNDFSAVLRPIVERLPAVLTDEDVAKFIAEVDEKVRLLKQQFAEIRHWYADETSAQLDKSVGFFRSEIARRAKTPAEGTSYSCDPDEINDMLVGALQNQWAKLHKPFLGELLKNLTVNVRFALPTGEFPASDLALCEEAILGRMESTLIRYSFPLGKDDAASVMRDLHASIKYVVSTVFDRVRQSAGAEFRNVDRNEIAELIIEAYREGRRAVGKQPKQHNVEGFRLSADVLLPGKIRNVDELHRFIANVVGRVEGMNVVLPPNHPYIRDVWNASGGDEHKRYEKARPLFERALETACLRFVDRAGLERLYPGGLWGGKGPDRPRAMDTAEFVTGLSLAMAEALVAANRDGIMPLSETEASIVQSIAGRLVDQLMSFLERVAPDKLSTSDMDALLGFIDEAAQSFPLWFENPIAPRSTEVSTYCRDSALRYVETVMRQSFPDALTSWTKDPNDPFDAFDRTDFSKGLPRAALFELIAEASRRADRELGMPVNEAFVRHIGERTKVMPEFSRDASDILSLAAWLFGKARATDAISGSRNRGGQPETNEACVRTREVNERHFESAIRHVLAVTMGHDERAQNMTLAQIAAGDYHARDRKEAEQVSVERADVVADVLSAFERVARDCKGRRPKVRLPVESYEQFDEAMKDATAAFGYFAKTCVPEKIIAGTSLIALHSFLGEATFTWIESLAYAGTDAKMREDLRFRLDKATQAVIVKYVEELNSLRHEADKPKVYPVPALLVEDMPKIERVPPRGNPAEFWDAECDRMLTMLSSSFAEACKARGVYFASKEQQARTLAALRAYFDGMRERLRAAVRGACARGSGSMQGVPAVGALRDAFLLAADHATALLPRDLPPTIAALLEEKVHMALLAGLADYESPHEFVRANDTDLRYRSWEASLGAQFSSDAGAREFSPGDLAEAADDMKLAATWAIVRKLLPASPAAPIPASSFDVGWVRVIHDAVCAGVDGHVAREPRTGAYVQEVTDRLFGASRRIVLLTKLGSAAEHAVRSVSPEAPEALRGMRSGLALDPDAAFTSVAEIEARVLRSIGRNEGIPYFDGETAVIDQFLANVLVLGEPVDEQLVDRADAVAALASQLNSSFHAGHPCRTPDALFGVLQERAERALDQLRARKTAETPMMPWNSEESASLRLAVEENRAWIATWPSASGEHGFLLQMIRRWHESSERVSRLSRNAAVPERDVRRALLDAETVRHAREKNIVSVSEPANGDGRRKKSGIRVQSYKVQGLLDWREDQDAAIQEGFSPARTSDDAVSAARVLRELGREQASIEATLALSKDDADDVRRRAEKLEADRAALARIEEELSTTIEALSASEAALSGLTTVAASILAELTRWTRLEREALALQGKQTTEHRAAANRASQRLTEYTSRGGRDAASLADLSNELQIAEERRDLHAMHVEDTNLPASIDALESLFAQLAEHSQAFPFDADAGRRGYQDAASLKKDARGCIDGFDEVVLLREEKTRLTRALAGMRSLVRDQELRLNGDAPLETNKAALRRRHAGIAEAIAAVRVALESALPKEHD